MMMRTILAVLALLTVFPAWAIGDPAATYCESRGGRIVDVAGVNGGRRTLCELPDRTRVDAWVYFRNTHRTTH